MPLLDPLLFDRLDGPLLLTFGRKTLGDLVGTASQAFDGCQSQWRP